MRGYVYVMANESMPGIVKIGRTSRVPQDRADELYTTGVPSRFDVIEQALSEDCVALEAACHKELAYYRLSTDREFFAIGVYEAVECLLECQKRQLQ